jgi:hypothetical protein
MENIAAALIGALIGALITRYFSRRDAAEQRSSTRASAFVTRVAPVFGALLSSELPDVVKDRTIPARFKSEWASLAREGSILGLFQDSHARGVTVLIEVYAQSLIAYSNGDLSRDELEIRRKDTITNVERVLAQIDIGRDG